MSKTMIISAALIATLGVAGAHAHQYAQDVMAGPQGQMGQYSSENAGYGPGMMHGQGFGYGMMGGMMGGMHEQMMLVMMDTDSDGVLSLEEFLAMPTRMFGYLDANGDGTVDADEIAAFCGDDDATE